MGAVDEAFAVKTPRLGAVAVISVGTSSARTNLAAAAQLDAISNRHFVTLQADDQIVYCAFNNADAGTADETATSGATRVFALMPGQRYDFWLTDNYTWLVHKGAAATKLRAYVSSFSVSE